jgi:multidrug efflux pump subunit AcrB
VNISHFFIDRPIFATVLSIVITLVGGIALMTLPSVTISLTSCPPTGECVGKLSRGQRAKPWRRQSARRSSNRINGVEKMLYMSSQSSSDGSYSLTITFALGTNLDTPRCSCKTE